MIRKREALECCPDTETDLSELVSVAADRCLAAIQRGEEVSVEQLAEQYPRAADIIRGTFPALMAMQRNLSGSASNATSNTMSVWGCVPCPTGAAETNARPDQSTFGGYRIVRHIARGGMGSVYEAVRGSDNHRVAIKVLPTVSGLDSQLLRRFRQEIRVAHMLKHPNVVSVLGSGCELGLHYYVMQLVNGPSLREFIDSQRQHAGQSLDYYRRVARIAARIARGLHYAHQQGVVHRDIKPSNVMLDNEDQPRIVDFGLVHVRAASQITMAGDLIGTWRYMSPEQACGHLPIDHRTDIYSLGATLYELLTLQPAIASVDWPAFRQRIERGTITRPRAIVPDIPRALETIVLKAMARLPDDRYATADEFADDLERFASEQHIMARLPNPLFAKMRQTAKAPRLAVVAIVLVGMMLSVTHWARSEKHDSGLEWRGVSRVASHPKQALIEAELEDIVNYLLVKGRRAQSHREARRYHEAMEELRDGHERSLGVLTELEKNFEYRWAYTRHLLGLGCAHMNLGEFRQGEQLLRESIQRYDGMLTDDDTFGEGIVHERNWANIALGEVLALQERDREAIEVYRGLLVDDSSLDNAQACGSLMRLGDLLWRAGDQEGGRDCFRKVLAMPERDSNRNSRLLVLTDCPSVDLRRPLEAVELARQRYTESDPDDAVSALQLGKALYRAGNYAAAHSALQEAAECHDGGDSETLLFLGMTTHRLGDHAAALVACRKASSEPQVALCWETACLPRRQRALQLEAATLLGVSQVATSD